MTSKGSTVPANVDSPLVLKRFLLSLVERLDTVTGVRGNEGAYVTARQLAEAIAGVVTDTANVYIGPTNRAPTNVTQSTLLILRDCGAPAGETSIVVREANCG